MSIQLTYKQKLELAIWIAKENFGAITGSIMLRERGIELGREPDDIDIILETISPKDIILPPLCYGKENGEDNDGYKVLARCYFFGTKIEFITVDKLKFDCKNSLRLALVQELLEAKEYYLQEDDNEAYIEKTKRDIEIIKDFINNKDNK